MRPINADAGGSHCGRCGEVVTVVVQPRPHEPFVCEDCARALEATRPSEGPICSGCASEAVIVSAADESDAWCVRCFMRRVVCEGERY